MVFNHPSVPSFKRRGSIFILFLNMKIFNRKSLKPRRQDLRNNPTQAEAFLWGFLKHSQFEDKKFRRQASIGSYIVDFYCPSEKLIIELDGEVHFDEEAKKYDAERTKYLESLGLKVIRFENQEVIYNLDKILKEISKHFKN
jgi:very-short-patch-repair endonuclease